MKTVGVLLTGVVLFVVILFVLRLSGLESTVYIIMERIEQAGLKGQLLFALLVAASVVFMLPSVMFTVGAGYLFGVMHGSTLVVVSETIGSAIAFLIARYALGSKARHWLKKQAKIAHVSESLFSHGWKVIAAFRIIPFFPFKLSNYFFGLLPVSFAHYLVGTLIGLWPITLFNVYIGSTASSLMALAPEQRSVSMTQWFGYGSGLFIGIAAIVYLSRIARRTLSEYENEQ